MSSDDKTYKGIHVLDVWKLINNLQSKKYRCGTAERFLLLLGDSIYGDYD